MYAVRQLLHLIVWVYLLVVFGRLILAWIRVFARDWRPKGVMLVVAETVYTLTDPPLRALRKVVPPLRIGGWPSTWHSCCWWSCSTFCSRSSRLALRAPPVTWRPTHINRPE